MPKQTEKMRDFNIVIVPPASIKRRAIALSKSLKSKDSLFNLDNVNHFPHLTIYMAVFPITELPKIKAMLHKTVKKIRAFNIVSTKYRVAKSGYVDIAYTKSAAINKLQMVVIKNLNGFRGGHIRKSDQQKLASLTKSEQDNIKKYGYRAVGKNYVPHLTLARFKKLDKKIIKGMKWRDFSFKVNAIGLYYLGNHGTCRQEIAKFNLA